MDLNDIVAQLKTGDEKFEVAQDMISGGMNQIDDGLAAVRGTMGNIEPDSLVEACGQAEEAKTQAEEALGRLAAAREKINDYLGSLGS